jgi:hypothetical protein
LRIVFKNIFQINLDFELCFAIPSAPIFDMQEGKQRNEGKQINIIVSEKRNRVLS